MGGRGASSGTSKKGNAYGTQYRSALTFGNIKFVTKNARDSESLMETMTKGRVYAHVEGRELKSISYFGDDGKRVKQIDIDHTHKGMQPHTHHGYLHNEQDGGKGASGLTSDEVKMVERVSSVWNDYLNGK